MSKTTKRVIIGDTIINNLAQGLVEGFRGSGFRRAQELLDEKYNFLRSHLPTRKTFFDDLRVLTRYLYFDSWDHLLTFMLDRLVVCQISICG